MRKRSAVSLSDNAEETTSAEHDSPWIKFGMATLGAVVAWALLAAQGYKVNDNDRHI